MFEQHSSASSVSIIEKRSKYPVLLTMIVSGMRFALICDLSRIPDTLDVALLLFDKATIAIEEFAII